MDNLIAGSLTLFFSLLTGGACGFSIWRFCKANRAATSSAQRNAGVHGWVATWTGLATAACMVASFFTFPRGVGELSRSSDPNQILVEIQKSLTHEVGFVDDELSGLQKLKQQLAYIETLLQQIPVDRDAWPRPQQEPVEFIDSAYVPLPPKKKVN